MKIGSTFNHEVYGPLKITKKRYSRMGNKSLWIGVDENGEEHELDGTEKPAKMEKESPKFLKDAAEVLGMTQGPKGEDADEDYIIEAVIPRVLEQIRQPENGKDGADADVELIIRDMLPLVMEKMPRPKELNEALIIQKVVSRIRIPQDGKPGEKGKDGSPDTPAQVKDKLESLKGDDRLDAKAIKNLPKQSTWSGGGGIKRIDAANDTRIISPTNGQTLVWNSTRQVWENSSAGGGSGTVDTIVAGNNIDVDATDPANPIVSVETLTLTDISDITASTAEVNVLDGIPATLTATELGYMDGVTSAVQTQLNGKVSDTGDTMTGDLIMSTDKRIKLNTSLPTNTAVGLIQLKFNDNEAKAILAYVDENDSEVVWLQAHNYLTFPGNQHKHFSIEASDAAGLKQTRFSVSYGADVNVVNVNAADFYVAGTGGIRTIDSDFDGILKLTPVTTFDVYPQSGSTYGLRTTLSNTDEVTLSAIGSSYLYLNDNFMINTATGADYASLLRFGGEGASNFQGGYIQYDAAGNEFIIGTHNTADELNASDVEVIRINRAGTLVTSTAPLTLGISNAFTAGSIELGHATDTTLSRSAAGVLAVEGVVVPTISSTNTLTNKRRTRRLATTNAPGATPTTNSDNVDVMSFTGLNTAITSMTTNLSGTPVDGDLLEFRFTDDGTARAITWGASFAATTVALPTTTVISTILRVGFEYSGSTWKCIATC